MAEGQAVTAVFVAIYKTRLLSTTPFAQTPNVRVEVFDGPRSLTVPSTPYRVLKEGDSPYVAQFLELALPPGERFLMVVTQIEAVRPLTGVAEAQQRVDRAIAALSLELTPLVFQDLVYRGWVLSKGGLFHHAWIVASKPLFPTWKPLFDALVVSESEIGDEDLDRRYSLMSRWYARALIEDPNEERFLFLWTMLEVYPMKDTSNIRPLQDFLARRVARSPIETKRALQLGELHGMRSDLVHDGALRLDERDRTFVLKLLQSICLEVLSAMLDRRYTGSLEQYFAASVPAA